MNDKSKPQNAQPTAVVVNEESQNAARRRKRRNITIAVIAASVLYAAAIVAPVVILNSGSTRTSNVQLSNVPAVEKPQKQTLDEQTSDAFRKNFISSCTSEAGTSADKAVANQYCECMYDRLIEQYSMDELRKIDTEIFLGRSTADDYPEFIDIAEKCVDEFYDYETEILPLQHV